jgi:hypothetical protein
VQGKPIGQEGMCSGNPGASRAQQQRLDHFYAVVAGPASWSRSGDVLTLSTPGTGPLHLTTNRSRAPMLSGTSWKLVYYSGTDQDEHPATTPVPLTVRGGMFTAGLNCGLIFGIARVSAQTIRFSTLGPSSCAAGPDAASQIVLEIVGARVATYAIRGNQLIVDGKNGRQLIYQS